jgi:hypothetical protein
MPNNCFLCLRVICRVRSVPPVNFPRAIIKGSKRGVGAAALVKKTGFDLKKVRNIIQRTYKMGKIKRVGKGVYVGS